MPQLFIQRNHVLAAATCATVVIEAPVHSGARSTAKAARRLNRLVCVVPHAPWDPRGAGCNAEIALGGVLVKDVEDLITLVEQEATRAPDAARSVAGHLFSAAIRGVPPGSARSLRRSGARIGANPGKLRDEPDRALANAPRPIQTEVSAPADLDPAARNVFDILGRSPRHIDEVCVATGLPFASVTEALLTLTLYAVVVEGPAGSYRRACR
jgi:DNA processing protein